MIQLIAHCDRCHKILDVGEGYAFNICSRIYSGGAVVWSNDKLKTTDMPFAGELCDGCYNILHFFLKERFREDAPR